MTNARQSGTVGEAMTKELVDSGSLLGDWAALRERIASTGYVFVRGLLSADMVRAVGRSGLRHLQQAGWTAPDDDPVQAQPLPPIRAVRMRDAFGDPGYRRIIADPTFNAIPFTSPLADLMAQILGPHGFCYPLKIPRVVYPIRLVPRQPGNFVHKDYGSVQDMFTCWVPLGDVPRTLGGLACCPAASTARRSGIARSLAWSGAGRRPTTRRGMCSSSTASRLMLRCRTESSG